MRDCRLVGADGILVTELRVLERSSGLACKTERITVTPVIDASVAVQVRADGSKDRKADLERAQLTGCQ
jgi:hypothetical protein